MKTHLTMKSANVKTGPIPVSTTSGESCPKACPFNSSNTGGCYAESGPLAIHWKQVTAGKRGMDWDDFVKAIAALPDGQLWRHNQAGDLLGTGDKIDAIALWQLVEANKGKRGFTYTHKPMTQANQAVIRAAVRKGFTINLSANNPEQADQLVDLHLAPVVTVLPAEAESMKTLTTPKGRKIVVCPAFANESVSCATCQLCQRQGNRPIIGFPAHGSSKRKAIKVVLSA